MDEIWWQKVLCEFHVARKHTVGESSGRPQDGRVRVTRDEGWSLSRFLEGKNYLSGSGEDNSVPSCG
jgi:hypothetical protein